MTAPGRLWASHHWPATRRQDAGTTPGTDGWLPAGAVINALATSGSLVFAAGSFQNAHGVATADAIAYFDGATWRPIGTDGAGNGPIGAALNVLAMFRTKVYTAGSFTSAGGDVRAQYLAAYALKLPDERIGLASAGPFVGNGVHSATGAGESRTRTVKRGHSGTFHVSIQNDGLVAADFTLKGTGSARGFSVRYYRGTTNITSRVKAGTYATGAIAARASITIRVVISEATCSAASVSYLVKASSVAGTPADAVKVIVKRG